MTILIAGAGIAGLSLGLTLHQIGAPFRIYEASRAIRPLGVGINLQPHAVRELIDLGLGDMLDRIGVRTRHLGFYSRAGLEIWTEPRGRLAGYRWPQYSVHRGAFQMALHEALIARAGPDCIATGQRGTGYADAPGGAKLLLEDVASGARSEAGGALVVAADGIHSALRAQMVPGEGPPIWGGAVLWRATTRAKPFLDGATMVMIGAEAVRFVAYPISGPDPETGLATINWIAEKRFPPEAPWTREDYNRRVPVSLFRDAFADWRFDWIDAPALIDGAAEVFEFPMVDREPLESWTDGRMTLIGDAAHATYPVGSSGASQAIVDARVLGAKLVECGVGPAAAAAYEAAVRPGANAVIRANRGAGPDAVLQWVEDRCGGVFDDIEAVIPRAELAAHAAKYKKLAGFSIDELNALPPTIPPGARIG